MENNHSCCSVSRKQDNPIKKQHVNMQSLQQNKEVTFKKISLP